MGSHQWEVSDGRSPMEGNQFEDSNGRSAYSCFNKKKHEFPFWKLRKVVFRRSSNCDLEIINFKIFFWFISGSTFSIFLFFKLFRIFISSEVFLFFFIRSLITFHASLLPLFIRKPYEVKLTTAISECHHNKA